MPAARWEPVKETRPLHLAPVTRCKLPHRPYKHTLAPSSLFLFNTHNLANPSSLASPQCLLSFGSYRATSVERHFSNLRLESSIKMALQAPPAVDYNRLRDWAEWAGLMDRNPESIVSN